MHFVGHFYKSAFYSVKVSSFYRKITALVTSLSKRHDTQHNGILHYDIQHNDTQHNNQANTTLSNKSLC
jgi:hypothetical protein